MIYRPTLKSFFQSPIQIQGLGFSQRDGGATGPRSAPVPVDTLTKITFEKPNFSTMTFEELQEYVASSWASIANFNAAIANVNPSAPPNVKMDLIAQRDTLMKLRQEADSWRERRENERKILKEQKEQKKVVDEPVDESYDELVAEDKPGIPTWAWVVGGIAAVAAVYVAVK